MKNIMTILGLTFVFSTAFAESAVVADCSTAYNAAQAMVQADGTVDNESDFLTATKVAVQSCGQLAEAKGIKSLKQSIDLMKNQCDAQASQGMSDLYRGTCYLKLADLTRFILGE